MGGKRIGIGQVAAAGRLAFLVWAAAVLGSRLVLAAPAGPPPSPPPAAPPAAEFKPFTFIHAGDTELGSPDLEGTTERFALLAERANRLGVAFVVIAGDLTHDSSPEQLQAFDECRRRFRMPVKVVPGNHDEEDLDTFKKHFGPDHYVFTHNNCDFVCLNSNRMDDYGDSADAKAQWRWLEEVLGQARRENRTHLFVVMHHPVIDEPLAARLTKYGVEAVLCGDLHTTTERPGKGYTVYVTPGTAKFRDGKGLGYRLFKVEKDRIEQQMVPLEKEIPAAPAPGEKGRCLVGAIRWDAWHGDRGGPGKAVEKSLGPKRWHHRLPFYAREVSDTEVQVRADSQAVMDQEIAYARAAGLDYWAFVAYPPDDPMSLGLKLYLASEHKADVRFCLNLQGGWLGRGGKADWPNKVALYVEYFKDASYQRAAGGRPLVYVFMAGEMVGPGKFDSWADAKVAFDDLRRAAAAAGLPSPYVVIQGFTPEADRETAQKLGADAISAYALPGGSREGTPFAALAARARQYWDRSAKTGAKVVPIVSAGWDRRPRAENPVPWERGPGSADHYAAPTPQELAAHLKDALDWSAAHPEAAEAGAVLIYAWNELDEGGWIVPTLAEGTARLDAIAEVLRRR